MSGTNEPLAAKHPILETDFRSSDIDVQMITSNQHPSGAYAASPTYSQYPHCWLRDGSFIAYAMDRAGESESSGKFHRWVASTVLRHAPTIRELLLRGQRGEAIGEHEFLPARFSVWGAWQQDGWPNFQLDGYGHWLWSLGEHLRRNGQERASEEVVEAAQLVGAYLKAFWLEPCYDPWEEYRSQLHTSTLASIYGGLKSVAAVLLPELESVAGQVRAVIVDECVAEGRFVKHIQNVSVDASLLWVSTPFNVVSEDDSLMVATVEEIERMLVAGGGLKRYTADTFYGGGEWILLTAWLGWYHTRIGRFDRARECLAWIESHRRRDGSLPEQVSSASTNRRFLAYWTQRWGEPADPLLWSHAMTLILRSDLQARGSSAGDCQAAPGQ